MPPDPDPAGAFAPRFEYANENRQATIGLGGTNVAVLTFLLIFLYGRFSSGGFDEALFRVTLATVVLSIFFLGISGTYYYLLLEALERRDPDPRRFLEPADGSFVIGLALMFLEPTLILVVLGIYDVGALAAGLWILSLVLIARGRQQLLKTAPPRAPSS